MARTLRFHRLIKRERSWALAVMEKHVVPNQRGVECHSETWAVVIHASVKFCL
ncbi:MAG: hypothetical protein M2R46_01507 [Verrucomicrobia subdivision 3 bacterium]|nr:hypothetical protein [Limisphaerales bacterium]